MSASIDEWDTVANAARTLGLSDRHARRLAAKLSARDRQSPPSGPMRVRVSALRALKVGHEADTEIGSVSAIQETSPPPSADLEQMRADLAALTAERDALKSAVVGLEADKERLWSDFEEERRIHAAEIERRDQAEGELRRLMLSDRQEIAQLRQQLAITPPREADTEPSGEDAPQRQREDQVEAQSAQGGGPTGPRPWWRFWGRV